MVGFSENFRKNGTSPFLTGCALAAGDLLAVVVSATVSIYLRLYFEGRYPPELYWQLWPFLALFLIMYAAMGLYPGVLLTPPSELRRTTQATSVVFLALGAITFVSREAELYSRGVFAMFWALTLVLVPCVRGLIRHFFASRRWWGYPVVVLGAGLTGSIIVHNLRLRPRLGLKPIAIFDDNPAKHGRELEGIPVLGTLEDAEEFAQRFPKTVAIFAMPGISKRRLKQIMATHGHTFSSSIVIPDMFGLSTLWVSATDIGGVLGLEIKQKLLDPSHQATKRVMDILITVLGGVFALPFVGLVALAIKLETRGPVFYKQERIGYEAQRIKILKFRTMVVNGEEVLNDHLQKDEAARCEWDECQKLRHDPRITRVGALLRKYSLDELPQIWNVLRGELSLVGPRPIVNEEVPKYDESFALYTRVKPGMTGLWQVSGRNNLSYDDRINLDVYYIRNWSIWFDIYILFRTPFAVFSGSGAY